MDTNQEIESLKLQLAAAEAALVQAKQEAQANLMQLNLIVAERDEETRKLAELTQAAQENDASLRAANTALQEQVARLTEVQRSANIHHGKDNQKMVVPTDDAGRAVYWKSRAQSAEGQNTALSAQVEELKRDGERLTWLCEFVTAKGTRGFGELSWSIYDDEGVRLNHHETLSEDDVGEIRFDREAIDAARAHAKQGGQEEGA